MKIPGSSNRFFRPGNFVAAVGVAALTACLNTMQAQSISVPNYSFEQQSGVGWPFGTNPNVDNWQKNAEPPWFAALSGGQIPWYGTAGVFIDSNPYGNLVGTQAGYILAFPEVALFQDYTVSPAFDATFEIGKAYNLTVGVYGKGSGAPLAPGATLTLSLYYRNGLGDKVTLASTPVVYSSATFPSAGPFNFIDYTVSLPQVQAGDAWAGQYIGIQLESTIPFELTTGGNWDFDNVRLTAVPEPTALALLGLGLGGVFVARRRRG
ncbi:MAG TPA: PEP-CTERM sorting domain-containing protein [Verrucomicrobiae bacterium]|nr:PEP-CTERM sorting domain-containing protein [Verrucomicrobiae bacterium]